MYEIVEMLLKNRRQPMESKLTCPKCEGSGKIRVAIWFDCKDTECWTCNGSGDLLQGEMTEARARAILKAARDKCGGFVSCGDEKFVVWVPIYDADPDWGAHYYPYVYEPLKNYDWPPSHEFAFRTEDDITAFLSSPRVTESLDFIFRPKQS